MKEDPEQMVAPRNFERKELLQDELWHCLLSAPPASLGLNLLLPARLLTLPYPTSSSVFSSVAVGMPVLAP